MVKIGNMGHGGQGLSEGHKGAGNSFAEVLGAVRDELDNMRTQHSALLAKLDADTGLDDDDYAATLEYGAAKFEK